MALVGVMMYGLFRAFSHYFIEGVGYATIQAVFSPSAFPGRGHRRGLRGGAQRAAPFRRARRALVCDGGQGRDGWRRHRRSDDRGHVLPKSLHATGPERDR
jgi:hypothetical protein